MCRWFATPLLLLLAAASFAADELNLGDPAPALNPKKWIKGLPLKKFEKDHVYVVEFWATWCGPCKEAIPRLTELAKKYRGKVDFLGMDVWEGDDAGEPALPRVEAFVKAKGAEMDYHVAADAPDNRVANAWLKAAGEGGIPTAFVVDKDGRVAAIVHSPNELDKVLPKVLDGTLDVAAIRAQRDRFYAPYRAIQKALSSKDYQGAVKTIDDLVAKDPESLPSCAAYLFIALAHLDSATFQSRARGYLAERGNSMDAYNMLCAIIDNEKGLAPETYSFGIVLANEGAKLKIHEALFLSIASELSETIGDKDAALRYAEATVKSADVDPNCAETFRSRARKRLASLKAKAL